MASIGCGYERLDLVPSGDGRGAVVATLVGRGIKASHVVQPHYADDGLGDLVEYFAELEQSWRGWDGRRSWSSLEGELTISAHHAGSHVVLRVELQHWSLDGSAEWAARLDLTLGAGDELSSAVAAARELLEHSSSS